MIPDILVKTFPFNNPVGDSFIAKKVYTSCPISLPKRVILVYLVELDMLDFDVILAICWLHYYFDSIHYRTSVVKVKFTNKLIIKLKGGNSIPRDQIISFQKACKMISKGCL